MMAHTPWLSSSPQSTVTVGMSDSMVHGSSTRKASDGCILTAAGGLPMNLEETVRRLLMDAAGEALCDWCLAFACSSSLMDMRAVTEDLLKTPIFHVRESCASCRRTVPAVAYPAKCAHCSQPILAHEPAKRLGDEPFHAACVRILLSEHAIRTSNDLTRQSRRLVADARRQINKAPSSD